MMKWEETNEAAGCEFTTATVLPCICSTIARVSKPTD
jgi:hypothetical protein